MGSQDVSTYLFGCQYDVNSFLLLIIICLFYGLADINRLCSELFLKNIFIIERSIDMGNKNIIPFLNDAIIFKISVKASFNTFGLN